MNLPNTGDGEHGPIYLATERALWALGPALLLLIALGYPSQQAARQQAAVDQSIEIAAENAEYSAGNGQWAPYGNRIDERNKWHDAGSSTKGF